MGKSWAIPCQRCNDYPLHCHRCERIGRTIMAGYLREEIPIYLSEENRHNRQKKTMPTQIAATNGMSCRAAAAVLGVSAQTISRARRNLEITRKKD